VVSWAGFQGASPGLAALGEERFDATGLILLCTIRADGRPRLSPVEPVITDGELYLGMMWQSRKALDLQRDARCLVHNTVTDRNGGDGEFKVYGAARPVSDAEDRERYCQALWEKIEWRPEGDEWHLFSVDIAEVVFQRFGEANGGHAVERWLA
jgi:hypothetical protein